MNEEIMYLEVYREDEVDDKVVENALEGAVDACADLGVIVSVKSFEKLDIKNRFIYKGVIESVAEIPDDAPFDGWQSCVPYKDTSEVFEWEIDDE